MIKNPILLFYGLKHDHINCFTRCCDTVKCCMKWEEYTLIERIDLKHVSGREVLSELVVIKFGT